MVNTVNNRTNLTLVKIPTTNKYYLSLMEWFAESKNIYC